MASPSPFWLLCYTMRMRMRITSRNCEGVIMIMKKELRETQTLRAGCSKAEPKFFAPPQTPFMGAQDGQNLISWRRSLPSPTDPVWWRSMHAISSYRGNRPNKQINKQTLKHTNKRKHRQDRLQYTAPLSLARSVMIMITIIMIIISCAGGRHNMPPPPASWPVTFWLWKWCPSHVRCVLPLC